MMSENDETKETSNQAAPHQIRGVPIAGFEEFLAAERIRFAEHEKRRLAHLRQSEKLAKKKPAKTAKK
jgi:hypothetical protein